MRIKPVRDVMTDIEDKKNPDKRVETIVHTMSVSVFNKPRVPRQKYEFDYRTDIGTVGKEKTA